ncbi:MAG: hypothetical protein M3003_10050 [Candidatus Dormibacteraeota bacterium]|nr:hypothetical protein [Candidatus Dormibacteraeota bacterium]MDQ6871976.1 hypothetical protein [Gemmatimonadota bacterium]
MPKKKTPLPVEKSRLVTFMLADHAEAVNGKLYVTGGSWNMINAKDIPYVHPHMSVAATIEVPWTQTNELHSLNVQLFDEDEKSVVPQRLEGQFEVGRPPGMRPGDYALVVLVFHLNGLTFDKAGSYSFVMTFDAEPLGRTKFRLQQVSQTS